MTRQIEVASHQFPTSHQGDIVMAWNLEEYYVTYDRRTRVLTVEEFMEIDDNTGDTDTTVITDPAEIKAILDQFKPGWPSLDGFTLLQEYYGDGWTIGTEPT